MRRLSLLFLVMFALIDVGQVSAFGYRTCLDKNLKWGSNLKTLRADLKGFAPISYWRKGLQEGIDKFNLNPSNFRYRLEMDSGGVRLDNGQSEIWWSADSRDLQGAPAIAYSFWTCYWFFGYHVHMDEVDVLFDSSETWKWTANSNKSSLNVYTGNGRLLQGTAVHEFGHGLKLDHENRTYNVMGEDYSHVHVNGSKAHVYVGEDAANGVVFLYGGNRSSWEDVGVVHWKYSHASGEYSRHKRTRVYSSTGGSLSTYRVNGEVGYRVRPGQEIQAEFTYENNGKNFQSAVKIGYFISTNDLISTSDQRIGGLTLNLHRGVVYTVTKTLTIPRALTTNKNYWLGAIIDEDDSVAEAVEWNNATYIPLRIQ